MAALAHTAQPQQVIRPDMLASVDVSDDNWYFNLDVCIHFERGCTLQLRVLSLEELLEELLADLQPTCTKTLCVGL